MSLPPTVLERLKAACYARDVAEIYRVVQRCGWSQRQIAAATGQSQSEISEILKGRRVQAYDVLVRIAEGLGIPRGWLGLAYADTAPVAAVKPPAPIVAAVAVDTSPRWVIGPVPSDDHVAPVVAKPRAGRASQRQRNRHGRRRGSR